MRKEKSYLDLFLDNAYKPKKRSLYFLQEQEDAIVKINSKEVPDEEKAHLYEEIIVPAFKDIVKGVLEMPKFHNLLGLNRNDLIEETFCRLVEKIERFTPGRIGKNGQPVKAYSYFSTIAKNFILEKKVRHEKILKHKADIETSIDLHILSEDTLQKMSNYDKQDISFESYEESFKETSDIILSVIDSIIKREIENEKYDDNIVRVGYVLKYLIKKWNNIEFDKKNEFMRILILYTGLKQQQVSSIFKKYKVEILKKIKPFGVRNNKNMTKYNEDEEENDLLDIDSENVLDKEMDEKEELEPSYDLRTMEDFEQFLEKKDNIYFKQK